ncbi:uncharacterized protein V6R79_021539 [Siganus canaliculatus]
MENATRCVNIMERSLTRFISESLFYPLTAAPRHHANWEPQWRHSLRAALTFRRNRCTAHTGRAHYRGGKKKRGGTKVSTRMFLCEGCEAFHRSQTISVSAARGDFPPVEPRQTEEDARKHDCKR